MTSILRHLSDVCRRASRPWRLLERDATGSVAIEYSLIAALIAMAIIVTLGQLGTALVDLPLPALVDAFASALS